MIEILKNEGAIEKTITFSDYGDSYHTKIKLFKKLFKIKHYFFYSNEYDKMVFKNKTIILKYNNNWSSFIGFCVKNNLTDIEQAVLLYNLSH